MWTLLLFEALPLAAIACGLPGAILTFPYGDRGARRQLLPALVLLPVPAVAALIWALAFRGQADAEKGVADWRTWFIYLTIVGSFALPVMLAPVTNPARRFIHFLDLAMIGLTTTAAFVALMIVTDSYL